MVTDGLVERRYEPIDDGINRLCQVVTPGPPEGVCVSSCTTWSDASTPG
jgi:hypothetical protein